MEPALIATAVYWLRSKKPPGVAGIKLDTLLLLLQNMKTRSLTLTGGGK